MSKIAKLTLTEEQFELLNSMKSDDLSIQDFIKQKIFESYVYTVNEAIKRIKESISVEQCFILQDLFPESMEERALDALGKKFRNYIEQNDIGIVFVKKTQRAVYKKIK